MAKTLGIILGVVFLLVGILGFFPNSLVGETALFHANTAHNWVHLITGALFIVVALAAQNAVGATLKIFGVVYLLVALLGFFISADALGIRHVLGFIHVNSADNWLHVVLAIVVFICGVVAGKNKEVSGPVPTQGATM